MRRYEVMKRLLAFFAAILILCSAAASVSAVNEETVTPDPAYTETTPPASGSAGWVTSENHPPRYYDTYGLLTVIAAQDIEDMLDEISERLKFDVVIMVLPTVGQWDYREHEYALELFESMGYGYINGTESMYQYELNGCVLLLAMDTRGYGFGYYGSDGIGVFAGENEYALDDYYLPYLKEDNYYKAFVNYAQAVEGMVVSARLKYDVNGNGFIDSNDLADLQAQRDKEYEEWLQQQRIIEEEYRKQQEEQQRIQNEADYRSAIKVAVFIGVLTGFVIALIVSISFRRQLISVKPQNTATGYIPHDGIHFTRSDEIFLRRSVSRVRIQSDYDGGGSRGGGGSFGGGGGGFTSSGGHSGGGHSGRF